MLVRRGITGMIKAALFDLDGTFIDTAPDMGGALNNLLVEEGLPPLPLESIRPYVSQGGLVLTQLGFAEHVDATEIESLRLRYLQHYRDIVADNSRLFNGFEAIFEWLQQKQINWGIVTNKPEWLTTPLLEQLGIDSPVVICGDTLQYRKPHPLPLQVAAERLGLECRHCIYVGDDERDVVSGKAAGMKTLVAAYGYLEPEADITGWNADGIIHQPVDLIDHPLFF